jgi:ankyrin repeat protein
MFSAVKHLDHLTKLLPFVDVNAVSDEDGATPLIKACQISFEIAEMLLAAGATQSINVQDFSGRSALFHACTTSSPQIVELLINHGADVSLAVPDTGKQYPGFHPGWTPLFASLAAGVGSHKQKLAMLLNAGANIHAVDHKGNGVMAYLCPYV